VYRTGPQCRLTGAHWRGCCDPVQCVDDPVRQSNWNRCCWSSTLRCSGSDPKIRYDWPGRRLDPLWTSWAARGQSRRI
jgi:hypothetical protein